MHSDIASSLVEQKAENYILSPKTGYVPEGPKPPKVVVAIPCFNEERFVGRVVTEAKKLVGQVIVVDDGSSDDTAKVAEAAGALVVRHSTNRGVGAATRTCFEAAKANGADVVVTMDGDLQHEPNEILTIAEPVINGDAHLVIGSRFMNTDVKIPAYRRFGISVITYLYNVGSMFKITDAQSCFRAHSRQFLDSFDITLNGFGFSVEVLIEARARGFSIKEVPTSCIYHTEAHTSNAVTHGLGVVWDVIKLRSKSRRYNSV